MIADPDNPNLTITEMAVQALGDLTDSLVFVGGCATGLLVTRMRANCRSGPPKTWTSSPRSPLLQNITASKPCWPHAALSMIPRQTRRSAVG